MAHQTRVSLDVANEIITTRLFEAPRELVWRAYTESGQVEPWWGPVGFTTTTQQMDVRPGGLWRHTMHGPDGRDYPNRVAYTRVEPPALLAWAHDDDNGSHIDSAPWFHVTVTFEALGDRTLVTMRHIFASGAARDANIEAFGSVQGAIDTTDRLAGYLVTMPGACDFIISREYDAPREHVWQAWTDPLRLARWWGPAIFTNTVCEVDLRVGGRYRIMMSGPYPGPQVTNYPVDGTYLEVVEPKRLMMTMDCAGHPSAWHDQVKPDRSAEERNPAGTMLQTVSFEALQAQRTRLTIRIRMVSAEILASMQRIGMSEGWSESLDRLGAELQRGRF
jgi:uncharacterized protein YndB with AHSA1/START domain